MTVHPLKPLYLSLDAPHASPETPKAPAITGPVPMTQIFAREFQHKIWWCYTTSLAKVSVYWKDRSTTMMPLPSKPPESHTILMHKRSMCNKELSANIWGQIFSWNTCIRYSWCHSQRNQIIDYLQNNQFQFSMNLWTCPKKCISHETKFVLTL